MKKVLIGTTAAMLTSLFMSGNAMAATSWAGPYIGATLGATSMSTDFSDYDDNFDNEGLSGREIGASVGLHGGFNLQQGNFVYGIELAVAVNKNKTEAKSSDWGPGHEVLDADLKASGSLKARAGVAVGDSLVYVGAGLAMGRFKLYNEDHGDFGNSTKNKYGLAIAAGVDSMITKNLALRLQGEYMDFSTHDVTNTDGGRFGHTSSTLTGSVGISYKF